MSFWHVLTLVFVVLKATGYFDYSWVVVFTPVMLRYLLLALLVLVASIRGINIADIAKRGGR